MGTRRVTTTIKVHDFVDKQLGKVAPYGVYDIAANTGWVNVGTDADTGQFAVQSIRRWWNTIGRHLSRTPPAADHRRLRWLQRSRLRLWKTELAALAAETGLAITVCHLPPGTSKWNKIEHRLFSASAATGAADPWLPRGGHRNLRATTTTTGLTVNAVLDTTTYDRGIKITDKQITALEATQLHHHEFHGDWNYTLTADHTPTRPTEPT